MRWIVGIDLAARSRGAVHMAAWLRANHIGEPGPEFIAAHVVDERLRDPSTTAEVTASAERSLTAAAADAGVENPFSSIRVVFARSPEDGLAAAADSADIDGILIGRAAPRAGGTLVRLGSVARRLLRRLPAPILVVPPDLDHASVGTGAAVFATDLGETSVAAGRAACRIARSLARDVVAVHLDPSSDVGRDLLGDRTLLALWTPVRTAADVAAWVRANGLDVTRAFVSHEGVVEGLLHEAIREDAPLIACGSRRLGTVDRWFHSSVGDDLARFADRPVLVVPTP